MQAVTILSNLVKYFRRAHDWEPFEGEMLIGFLLITFLQIVCKIILNSKGIVKYSQTSIKRPLKVNVKSGLLKRWSLKKGLRV